MNKLLFIGLFCLSNLSHAGLQVFACEPEWAALANEIGGAHIQTFSATNAHQDPHKIQARPSLIAAYRRSDILVCTGADLEAGWLPALAKKGNNPKLRPGQVGYLAASELVEMLEVPQQIDRSMGDVHPQGNPHIQTDPRNFLPVAQELSKRFSQLDPEHAESYTSALSNFQTRWQQAIAQWETKASSLRDVPVISAHQGFPYLYAWLGLKRVGILEAKPGVQPSAGHLQTILQNLAKQPARMVLYATYQHDRPAKWLAKRSQVQMVEIPFTIGGAPNTDDLFSLFDVTIERLLAGLATPT